MAKKTLEDQYGGMTKLMFIGGIILLVIWLIAKGIGM